MSTHHPSRAKRSRSAASWTLLVCLAYTMWRPVSEPIVLYSALGLVATISLVRLMTRGCSAPRMLVASMIGVYSAALMAFIVGVVRDTPGVGQQGLVWLGGLFVWMLFAVTMDEGSARDIFRLVPVMTIILSTLILGYVLQSLGVLPAVLPASLMEDQGAGFNMVDGNSAIRFFGLSTLAAAGPFCVAATMAPRGSLLPSRWLTGAAALLASAASLVAGRRAIMAVILVTPLLFLIVRWLLARRARASRHLNPYWILAAPFLAIIAIWGLGTSAAAQAGSAASAGLNVYLGTGSTGVQLGDQLRILQAGELFGGWSKVPLAGSGLGGVLSSTFSRSVDRPWMFELQYHQMLFNLGLLGCAVIAVSGVCAMAALRRIVRLAPEEEGPLTAAVTASVALLVANATNPYLQAVGHGWGIALSLASGVAIYSTHAVKDRGRAAEDFGDSSAFLSV